MKPLKITRTYLATTIATVAMSGGLFMTTATPTFAAEPITNVAMADTSQVGSFTNATFKIKGEWEIVKQDGQTIFRLSDDFKTKNGPDLKLFLSPETVAKVTGKTAVNGAIRLSVLKSSKGSQDYVIPDNIDLSQFKSILIHCEAYSKLWGGADI